MHDNASHHISKIVKNWVVENKITLATQRTYSPDVNLQDCFIFLNFETFRRGRLLRNKDAVSNIVKEYLTTLKPTDFSAAFIKFGQHLQSLVDKSGDYLCLFLIK